MVTVELVVGEGCGEVWLQFDSLCFLSRFPFDWSIFNVI